MFTLQDTKLTRMYNGVICEVYYYEHTEENKVNKYTMLFDQASGSPMAFFFVGYDTLFGSHYDEYLLEYDKVETTVNSSAFDVYKCKHCVTIAALL